MGHPLTPPARLHGEPFPVPSLGYSGRRHPRCRHLKVQPRSASAGRRCDDALAALNAMSSPGRGLRPHFGNPRLPLLRTQQSVMERVIRRVNRMYADRKVCPRDAFQLIVKSHDVYDVSPQVLRPFAWNSLKLLRKEGAVSPSPLRPRLSPEAVEYYDNFKTWMLRPQSQLDALEEAGEFPRICPYWDPVLRSCRATRLKLFEKLRSMSLLGFRRRLRGRASFFFMKKKQGWIRMIIDGREASALCFRPPYTELGSAGALSMLDLSDEKFMKDLGRPQVDLFGAGLDLCDAFYQNTARELGCLFGFDYPELASVWGVDSVYDDTLGQEVAVGPSELLFPVFEGLPMGFSWSMYFCQDLTATALMKAATKPGTTPMGTSGLIRERSLPPPWKLSQPLISPAILWPPKPKSPSYLSSPS